MRESADSQSPGVHAEFARTTYRWEGRARARRGLHPRRRVEGGQAVVAGKGVGVPSLGAAQLIARVASVDGRVEPVVVARRVVAGLVVILGIDARVELAIGVKLARWLAVQCLRLMTMRARRAG